MRCQTPQLPALVMLGNVKYGTVVIFHRPPKVRIHDKITPYYGPCDLHVPYILTSPEASAPAVLVNLETGAFTSANYNDKVEIFKDAELTL